jgi:hypothetical protein
LTGRGSVSLLAALGCLALVTAGCATPARTVGLAIGAVFVAGAVASHNHDNARPDVQTPANPCSPNPERCR